MTDVHQPKHLGNALPNHRTKTFFKKKRTYPSNFVEEDDEVPDLYNADDDSEPDDNDDDYGYEVEDEDDDYESDPDQVAFVDE